MPDKPSVTDDSGVPTRSSASTGVVADLADALTDTSTPNGGPDTRPSDGAVLRYGKITAVGTGGNAGKVQTDATGTAWVSTDASYLPAVNDLVYLLMQGPVAHVGGKLGGTQPTSPPVGVIHAFAGAAAPDGWLLCDGTAVSRTTYAALYAVCGTIYGAGNGSTTFNLPDLRDRVPVGTSSMFVRGETGGAETRTLTTANMPAHNHTATQSSHSHSHSHSTSIGDHNHAVPMANGAEPVVQAGADGWAQADGGGAATGFAGGGTFGSSTDATSSTPAITVANNGSGTAFNNMPPYLGVAWIVRALP